jgi:hypothetical protein
MAYLWECILQLVPSNADEFPYSRNTSLALRQWLCQGFTLSRSVLDEFDDYTQNVVVKERLKIFGLRC